MTKFAEKTFSVAVGSKEYRENWASVFSHDDTVDYMPAVDYLTSGTKAEELEGFTSDGWYYWDACWAYVHGPYESHHKAAEALLKYGGV